MTVFFIFPYRFQLNCPAQKPFEKPNFAPWFILALN